MKLKPLFNRVLIEAVAEEAKATKSGIVLPDSSSEKKKQSKGVVIAIGDGRLNEKGERQAMSLKVGDRVLFKEPWSEDGKFEEDGKKLYLVDEEDILATIVD